MTTDNIMGPYASAAWHLHRGGWNPLPVMGKSDGLPRGFHGYSGADVSGADIAEWIEARPDYNVAARVPRQVAGIDVDAYGNKPGAVTLDGLVAEHGNLPATFRVSARFGPDYDGVSGIRLYRLPEALALHADDQAAGWITGWPGIDAILYGKRYVMAPPSIHPDLGTPYRVLNETTGEYIDALPPVDDLPELPAAWCAALTQGTARPRTTGDSPSRYWSDGKPCTAVLVAYGQSIGDLDNGRHDGALAAITRLTRLGEQGHAGVRRAIDGYRGAWHSAVTTGDGRRTDNAATAEWERMVTGIDAVIERAGLTSPDDRGCCPDPAAGADRDEDDGEGPGRKSAATMLVDLVTARYRLGISEDDDVFALPVAGPQVVRMLRGGKGSMRAELASAYFAEKGRAAPQQALADALLVLDGRARELDPETLWLRVGEHHGDRYLDLGDPTGRAVRITPTGWELTDRPPVLFRRTALTGALPVPVKGGNLDELWQLLNVTEDDRPLVLAWLVAALQPGIPHPIVAFTGEQGTGKTTAARALARVYDPSPAQIRKAPRDVEGWVVAAMGSWVAAVDNVSTIPAWFSDALCRAVTGDGDVRRRLYSDSDLAVFSFRRAVILTGIDLGALRGDLAERLVRVELAVIDAARRRTDRAMTEEWDRAHPRILGAVLDLAVEVASVAESLRVEELPRMADYARVLAAVDNVMGTDGLVRYMGQADALAGDVISSEPIIAAVVEQLTTEFSGTAAELLALLVAPEGRSGREWPTNPRAVTALLRRNSPALRRLGWQVAAVEDGHNKVLTWHLTPPGVDVERPHPIPATPATPAPAANLRVSAGVAGVVSGPSQDDLDVECPHGMPGGAWPDVFTAGEIACPDCREVAS